MALEQREELKGRGLTVWIDDDAVVIKYGVMNYGFLGTKRVPVSNITSVNWKEPGGWTVGFLELAILGEQISRHASPNVQHQNRLMFEKVNHKKLAELRDWIQARIGRPATPAANSALSVADELTKLSALVKDGFMTQDEFEAQKAKLLS